MATMKTEWVPDIDDYDKRTVIREISDDASVDEMFQAWKEFMSFMGYYMDNFYLQIEEPTVENVNVPERNTVEMLDRGLEHSYKS